MKCVLILVIFVQDTMVLATVKNSVVNTLNMVFPVWPLVEFPNLCSSQ